MPSLRARLRSVSNHDGAETTATGGIMEHIEVDVLVIGWGKGAKPSRLSAGRH